MNPIEVVGVVLALAYVVLAIAENPLCWPAAIVSSICFIALFFQAELYTESALQLFFIALAIQGYRRWGGEGEKVSAKIKTHSARQHIIGIVVSGAASLLLGYAISVLTKAPFAYVDSAITVFSIYTTYLVTEKILENWVYWIVIDVVAATLYLTKGLYLTSGLYALYVILALLGYLQWKKTCQMEQKNQHS